MRDNIQSRIIRDTNDLGSNKVPKMPILVALNDGRVGEARTIRGAVSLVIGEQYYDSEDAAVEYAYRLEAARKESMKAIFRGINAVVYDKTVGVIPGNYAAEEEDPDYIEDEPPIYIRIDTEELFLISFAAIGAIGLYEREDSYLLRPGNKNNEAIEYEGGIYLDISKEYDLNKLIASLE